MRMRACTTRSSKTTPSTPTATAGRAGCGIVYPLVPIEPAGPLDTQAAKNLDYLWNRAYLNAVTLGQWDENLDGTTVLRSDLANRSDYVGVNWYGGLRVTGWPVSFLPDLSPLFTVNPLTMVETPNQPDKLAGVLALRQRRPRPSGDDHRERRRRPRR